MKRLLSSLFFAGVVTIHADPLLTSWQTGISSKYARIYTSTANRTAGTSTTTWTGTDSQSAPAYAGINEIDASDSFVYILSTGLGAHVMGPWTNPNLPKNQQILWRFPRTPAVPVTNRTSASASPTTVTTLGEMGFMVDGVAAFNISDSFSYSAANSEDASPMTNIGSGDGVWNRDALVNEAPSFDYALAHNQQSGEYHYHVNPLAVRYLVGDNVLYNSTTKQYTENTITTTFAHSPILGWMKDGLPLYGPYGYDGGGTGATATASLSNGSVASVAIGNAGTYTAAPLVAFDSGSATATAEMGAISAIVATPANSSAGGTGYAVGDSLTVAGGTATVPATLTVTTITGSGAVASLAVTQGGAYTAVPPDYVSVTGGSGTGATPTLLWGVNAVNVTGGGSGYTTPPAVLIGGVRRMISGYQLRDGTNNTTNLNTAGRTTLAPWALAAQGRGAQITSGQDGPAVSTTYILGHYAEDYSYLGELGYTQASRVNAGGTYFDLDEYNTRFCITPDYPNGTWAYFTTIKADGSPAFPYSAGRWYRGNPNTGGGKTTAAVESSDGAAMQFLGGANTAITIGTPDVANGSVTLTWNAVEGGTYTVANSPNDATFTTEASGLAPTNVPMAPTLGDDAVSTTAGYSLTGLTGIQYVQVGRTALATYDSAGQAASTVAQSAVTSFSTDFSSASTASATQGQPFSYQIVASGNPTSYGASGLPAGLSIDTAAGLISGTPTVTGTFAVTLSATDANGTNTATLTLTVAPAAVPKNAPVIDSLLTISAPAGQAFSYDIAATNTPVSFAASGLPAGLAIDSTTGAIAGTPTTAGVYPVVLSASNTAGTGSATLSLTIAPALPVVTLTATTPEVVEGSGDIGEFTVTLSAAQASQLIVNYTIKGSAVNGTDYVLLKGTKKFKVGRVSKPIKIVPLGDLGGAAKRAVKLTLAAGTGYTVGTTTPVKVKILAAGQ